MHADQLIAAEVFYGKYIPKYELLLRQRLRDPSVSSLRSPTMLVASNSSKRAEEFLRRPSAAAALFESL